MHIRFLVASEINYMVEFGLRSHIPSQGQKIDSILLGHKPLAYFFVQVF